MASSSVISFTSAGITAESISTIQSLRGNTLKNFIEQANEAGNLNVVARNLTTAQIKQSFSLLDKVTLQKVMANISDSQLQFLFKEEAGLFVSETGKGLLLDTVLDGKDTSVLYAAKQNPVDFYNEFLSEFKDKGISFQDFVDKCNIDVGKFTVSTALDAAEFYGDKNIFLIIRANEVFKSLDTTIPDNEYLRNQLYTLLTKRSADIDSNELQSVISSFLTPDEIRRLDSIKLGNSSQLTTQEINTIYQFTQAGGCDLANINRNIESLTIAELEDWMNGYQLKMGSGKMRIIDSVRTINDDLDDIIEKRLNTKTMTGARYVSSVGSDINLEPYLNGEADIQNLVGMRYTDKANTSLTILLDKTTPYSSNAENRIKIEAVVAPNTGAFIETYSGLKRYSCMEFLTKRNSSNIITGAYWDIDGKLVLQTLLSCE